MSEQIILPIHKMKRLQRVKREERNKILEECLSCSLQLFQLNHKPAICKHENYINRSLKGLRYSRNFIPIYLFPYFTILICFFFCYEPSIFGVENYLQKKTQKSFHNPNKDQTNKRTKNSTVKKTPKRRLTKKVQKINKKNSTKYEKSPLYRNLKTFFWKGKQRHNRQLKPYDVHAKKYYLQIKATN